MTYPYNEKCFYWESCLDLLWNSFGKYAPIDVFDQIRPDFPSAENCSNLEETFKSMAYSVQNYSFINPLTLPTDNMAACQIVCGEADPRALFLSLGASSTVATGMCIFVVTLLVLASLYLTAILQHFTQWIPTLGSLTMSAGLAVFVVLYSDPSGWPMYNPQPVIAAMNSAIFSFFFSGFQYAISPGYEFGPAISIAAVGYPLWFILVEVPYEAGDQKSLPVLLASGLWSTIVADGSNHMESSHDFIL